MHSENLIMENCYQKAPSLVKRKIMDSLYSFRKTVAGLSQVSGRLQAGLRRGLWFLSHFY
jgi:hypothetical protein